jgi:hypothetical protein
MTRICSILAAVALAACFATNAFALTVLGSTGGQYLGYGYDNYYWSNMTSALNTATENNFDEIASFTDLDLMLTYDAIWLDARAPEATLTTQEIDNITAFLGTGRRAVLMGENSAWTAWDQQIVGIGGGTYAGANSSATTSSAIDNELTTGASSVSLPYAGVVAAGGISLYDVNFATLWGDNLLTVLDINVFSDSYWSTASNGQFAENVANWIANSGQAAPVPEPSTVLLLSGGLVGLAWCARKRKKA